MWTPNGESLVWAIEHGIEMWHAGSGAHELLVADSIAGLPAFSPDGDRVAYIKISDFEFVLFSIMDRRVDLRIDARAPGTTRAMSEALHLGGPSWSPDGKQVAYLCWDGAGDEVCVLDVGSGQVSQLTKLSEDLKSRTAAGEALNATSNMGPPSWSPDGVRIAVTAYPERRGAASGLFAIDVAGGRAYRLSDLLPNSVISWTADSSAVVFSATSNEKSDVILVSADGGTPENVTRAQTGSWRNPVFLANGDIAVSSSEGAIVVLRDKREFGRVSVSGLFADYPATRPGSSEISFQATPNIIPSYRET